MRYAYIKHGDAVDQVRRLAGRREFDRSGPDAFIGDFLQAHSNHDVLVLCRASADGSFELDNVRAQSHAGDRAHGYGLLRRIVSVLRIGAEIIRYRPDRIVCGCTGELLWVCVLVARILRTPIVNSRHGELQMRKGLASLISAADAACIKACTAVVCHGPFMAEQMLRLGVPSSRIFVFEVDLASFTRPKRTTPVSERVIQFARNRDRIFTFIGRVQRDKGVFDLLEAFAGLQSSPGSVGLIYAGDGHDLAELNDRVRERGLREQVLSLGRVAHADLPEIVRCSTAVVTPTRPEFPEGRCMVVLESLVLGVPVVAPASGPFPYAIHHNVNGLLFEPGSAESLKRALEGIVASGPAIERLREGARRSSVDLLKGQKSFSDAIAAAFVEGAALEPVRGAEV